ncbi:viral A-type inclusion protein [Reticulomyxa filosa]|uniref:Viral A-type inclusion protein n=1 Tax=Reticulomyxa filosa TaxID=46433 RepID=X6NTQ9_RETFI|nr:viral A-type inclusion protein [Reticulomyxa filosa]|eukprot:ETO29356.1 viral A-type inclusion protein [Reticulomyxa filosa]
MITDQNYHIYPKDEASSNDEENEHETEKRGTQVDRVSLKRVQSVYKQFEDSSFMSPLSSLSGPITTNINIKDLIQGKESSEVDEGRKVISTEILDYDKDTCLTDTISNELNMIDFKKSDKKRQETQADKLMQDPAKTKIKDVIKKLNEKINKLYNWHLVEIDLVSKQQIQLNEIRSELDVTKSNINTIAQSTSRSSIGFVQPAFPEVLEPLLNNEEEKDTGVEINAFETSHDESSNDYKPAFVHKTLQKCYEILKRESASLKELEAIATLVRQYECEFESGKQTLPYKSYVASPLQCTTNEKNNISKSTPSERGVHNSNNLQSKTVHKEIEFYNQEIEQLQHDLTCLDQTNEKSCKQNKTANKEASGEDSLQTKGEPVNEKLLNDCKLSLKHLIQITAPENQNIKSKVTEFHVVATKCEMFADIEIPQAVKMEQLKLPLIIRAKIFEYVSDLEQTKNTIYDLIMLVLQDKAPEVVNQKRNDITSNPKLCNTTEYQLCFEQLKREAGKQDKTLPLNDFDIRSSTEEDAIQSTLQIIKQSQNI